MITNKNICLIHTSSKNSKKSIYDDLSKDKGGVMYMICPESGSELTIPYKNNKERLEWLEIKKEIREELKMVS